MNGVAWAPAALLELLTWCLLLVTAALAAAAVVVRVTRLVRERRRAATERAARPLILAALGAENGPQTGTQTGMPALPRAVARSLDALAVSLAPKLRGADRDSLAQLLTRRGTVAKARRGTRSRRPIRRLRAVEMLGALGLPECLPDLRSCLRDRNDDVRRAATRAIGRTGHPDAVPALLDLLDASEQPVPPHCVTLALLRLGPCAAPGLVAAFGNAGPAARAAAAQVLGWLGESSAALVLITGLEDDDHGVRVACIEALGRIGVPAGSSRLQALAAGATSQDERLAATQALGRLGDPAAVHVLSDLLTRSHEVAHAAASSLAQIGPVGWSVLRAQARAFPEARESAAYGPHSPGPVVRSVPASAPAAATSATNAARAVAALAMDDRVTSGEPA